MKRIAILSVVICGGLFLGMGGSAIWERFSEPDRAARYEALFRQECLSRIAARAEKRDPYSARSDGFPEQVDERAGLSVQHSRDKCIIQESGSLLSLDDRDAVTSRILALIQTEYPELDHPGDPMTNWDFFESRTLHGPDGGTGNWGVIVMRVSANSGDALQRTTTSLALPRD